MSGAQSQTLSMCEATPSVSARPNEEQPPHWDGGPPEAEKNFRRLKGYGEFDNARAGSIRR